MSGLKRPRAAFAALAAAALLVPSPAAFAQAPAAGPAAQPLDPRPAPQPLQGRFLLLSDIHFDPFADPAIVPQLIASRVEQWPAIFRTSRQSGPARAGADTNFPLLRSTLDQAGRAGPPYDFVLVTGDLLAHDFEASFARFGGTGRAALVAFVQKTATFVIQSVAREFPGAALIPALGNNDSDCGDYMLAPGSPLLAALAAQLPVLASDPQAARDFAAGGNYALAHPRTPNHRILVLSNVFWSTRYQDACGAGSQDPGSAQLAWLEWQLFLARQRGQTASLVMHIPPGINPYGSTAAEPLPFWADRYRDRFLAIAGANASVLVAGYAGHTHMDDFRVISSAAEGPFLPIRISPSVTPFFGNNPSFSVVGYDRGDGRMADYVSYALPGSGWRAQYRFSQAYGLQGYSAPNLTSLSRSILSGDPARARYSQYYASGAPSPVTAQNFRLYACAQTQMLPDGYSACVGPEAPSPPPNE